MFLEKLDEREKEVFLDLAKYTAKTNGMVEDSEKTMIQRYCREMGINEGKMYDSKSVDEAAAFFAERPGKVRNIVLTELLMLTYADKKYDKEEKAFLKDLADKMKIGKDSYDTLKKDVEKFLDLKDEMKKHIKENS